MATPESINRLLAVAATLLDHAAAEARDAKLEPVRENIDRIDNAFAEVFEIQHQIYELQPKLKPESLKQPSEYPQANRLLTEFMYRASECELAGNIEARSLRSESSSPWSLRLCIATSRLAK